MLTMNKKEKVKLLLFPQQVLLLSVFTLLYLIYQGIAMCQLKPE